MRVELRYAPLPFIGAIAVHCWLVVIDATGACHRWEVWQTRNAGGSRSIGHVHCDLMPPEAGVGGGPSRIAVEWRGEAAGQIVQALKQITNYPHCEHYRTWPGPNSNTFVAWVLQHAGIGYAFPWKAFGARFARRTR